MSVVVLLIAAGGLVAIGFLGAFVWAVRTGQFDDTCTPAVRVLLDESGRANDQSSPRRRATADADRAKRGHRGK